MSATLVETPYGFGYIESDIGQYQLVRVILLSSTDFSNTTGSISLPWDRVRVLPERQITRMNREGECSSTKKRTSTDNQLTDFSNSRLRYISN